MDSTHVIKGFDYKGWLDKTMVKAVDESYYEIIKLLLYASADPNVEDVVRDGDDPLSTQIIAKDYK